MEVIVQTVEVHQDDHLISSKVTGVDDNAGELLSSARAPYFYQSNRDNQFHDQTRIHLHPYT